MTRALRCMEGNDMEMICILIGAAWLSVQMMKIIDRLEGKR